MKVILYPNLLKKDAYSCTVDVCGIMNEIGAEICMDESHRETFGSLKNIKFAPFSQLIDEADLAVAIGGDGTILKCASKMIGKDALLIGINTGTLGFMASVEKDSLDSLRRIATGEYRISERMLLTAEYTSDGKTRTFHALNDIVVTGAYAKIIDFDVYVNGTLTGSYRADGAVFATPTGSTAYSLSAGGPVIEPELECIEMNLICSHSLFSRPMIYTHDKLLTVVHTSPDEKNICFSVDGNEPVSLKRGEKLNIRKSVHKIKLVDINGESFYDALSRKLMRSLKGNQH